MPAIKVTSSFVFEIGNKAYTFKMERITRQRAILDIDGLRAVYHRNKKESAEEPLEIEENIHNMSIEGKIFMKKKS